MSEIVDGKKVFTLSELAASIQRAFGTFYNQNYSARGIVIQNFPKPTMAISLLRSLVLSIGTSTRH